MKKRLLTVCLMICALLFAPVCSAALFSDMIAFGDSLSDNGNVFTLTRGFIPDSKHYYEGRFSNGPIWVEYLADDLGMNGRLQDYAFGGARTSSAIPPGLREQVELFLEGDEIPDHALITIWIGANDLFGEGVDVTESVQNIVSVLEMLVPAGAEHFLIPNLPNLGATPEYNGTPESYSDGMEITIEFNQALKEGLDTFIQYNPGVTVYAMDVFELFETLMADHQAFGFTNISEPCPNFGTSFDGDGYLFWDEVHPTTRGHELMASEAASLIRSASGPLVDVKANGSDEAITVSPEAPVIVTVTLDPGLLAGQRSDVWIVTMAPFGVFSFAVPFQGWEEGIHSGLPSSLPEAVSSMEVLNRTLSPGTYTFYFALDDNADEVPDATWLDSVQVIVGDVF